MTSQTLPNQTAIVPGVYRVDLGMVNAFLLEDGDELALIDTGTPGSEDTILAAISAAGYTPESVSKILVTHLHADHTGSLAALKRVTGAQVLMHRADAALVAEGKAARPAKPAPGLMNWLIVNVFMALRGPMDVEPVATDREISEGDVLDVAGGLRVIHAPGHAAGQVCFLWDAHGGVLFAGDAAANMNGLGYPPIFEDQQQGIDTLEKLAGYTFAAACFGHGDPLLGGASQKFAEKWGA